MAAKKATDPSDRFGEGSDPEEDDGATEPEGGADGDHHQIADLADELGDELGKASLTGADSADDDSADDDSADDADADRASHGDGGDAHVLRDLADARTDDLEPAEDADDFDA